MSLKPWREIARPHKDVLEGTLKQSEFAADITQVANGNAPPEYLDAEKFFARTYITEGMRFLLISVARRLAKQGGDPVIQLQTAFGGGKTHTMLAVYHLARRTVGTDKLTGVPAVLDEAGIHDLPRANIAVLDGNDLSPSQPRKHGDITINTLWGELAWQLLGAQGYRMVAANDADGTSPGKQVLAELLRAAAPCVVLIDELVAFVRQMAPDQRYRAGSFDSNLSFVQALTEALKTVPDAVLLASLPESELEVGGSTGTQALNALEKYFARVEAVWKPVAAEEAFEIVRRRLFDDPGERAEVEGISRQFADYYRKHAEQFPVETQSNEYFERMCRSYPIHPEVFDRLYQDWSTLDQFQRTRGVLQLMATVIHRLWNADNGDALIMPGSLPLADSNVRNQCLHYLPHGWDAVVEREVDGPHSIPSDIDAHDTRFGSVQAARRSARTLFLGSAPSGRQQGVRGITLERILLGSVQPGQSLGVFEDVLGRLRDRLHHLYANQERLWLDTRPNLRREMESRKQGINDREQLQPLLKERVQRVFRNGQILGGVHVFTPSADVPDDYSSGPRLVILPTDSAYSRSGPNPACKRAEETLRKRGEQPRQKQNRLLFLTADADVVSRLKDQGRTYLAWRSIVADIESGSLNHDLAHLKQATTHRDEAEKSFRRLILETWKCLLVPTETTTRGKPALDWEHARVSTTAQQPMRAIEDKLLEEEWVIAKWSPIHLRNLLQQWYFKAETTEISALRVWQDSCQYLYMPRLVGSGVFQDAINEGVASEDFFGFASGKEGDKYLGFVFGKHSSTTVDEHALLIERAAAKAYQSSQQPPAATTPEEPGTPTTDPDHDHTEQDPGTDDPPNPPQPPDAAANPQKNFHASVHLDPVRARLDFSDIAEEVLQHFTAKSGVQVTISVDISATAPDGFDQQLQRTVTENCNTLKFINAEFEE